MRGVEEVDPALVERWVVGSARTVASYYGRFPLPHARVDILPSPGQGVRHGRASSRNGPCLELFVGRASVASDFEDDWILVHEMIHLALPDLDERHHWLEEGLPTYVEPLARAAQGALSEERVWRQFVWGMPKGLPRSGDRGLDNTPTWGRTYWGGALFCLVADIQIRERTRGARSLADTQRAILNAGGNHEARWPIARVLAIGDSATGERVLQDLYGQWANEPVFVDLDTLWARLGVRTASGELTGFDDEAPLAGLRRRLIAPVGSEERAPQVPPIRLISRVEAP